MLPKKLQTFHVSVMKPGQVQTLRCRIVLYETNTTDAVWWIEPANLALVLNGNLVVNDLPIRSGDVLRLYVTTDLMEGIANRLDQDRLLAHDDEPGFTLHMVEMKTSIELERPMTESLAQTIKDVAIDLQIIGIECVQFDDMGEFECPFAPDSPELVKPLGELFDSAMIESLHVRIICDHPFMTRVELRDELLS